MDSLLKRLKENWKLCEKYSADLADSPQSKYAKRFTSPGNLEKIGRNLPNYIPIAIFPDSSEQPMVKPPYGFDTAEEAKNKAIKLLELPGWKNVSDIRIDIYSGDMKIGQEDL